MAAPAPAAGPAGPAAPAPAPAVAVAWSNMSQAARDAYQLPFVQRQPNPPGAFPTPGTWAGARVLGQGGQGIAALWPKVNAQNRIVDRGVVKEVQMDNAVYNDSDTMINNDPREYVTQRACRPAPAHPPPRNHVVELRSWEDVPTRCSFRFYIEYCDHGSLEELLYSHKGWAAFNTPATRRFTRLAGHNTPQAQKPFEEPFLVSRYS